MVELELLEIYQEPSKNCKHNVVKFVLTRRIQSTIFMVFFIKHESAQRLCHGRTSMVLQNQNNVTSSEIFIYLCYNHFNWHCKAFYGKTHTHFSVTFMFISKIFRQVIDPTVFLIRQFFVPTVIFLRTFSVINYTF